MSSSPKITPADLGPLKKQGYQVLRGLFSAEAVSSIRGLLEKEARSALLSIKPEVSCSDDPAALIAFIKKANDDSAVFQRLSKRTRDILTGHFPVETRLSPALEAIPRSERLGDVLRAIFPGQGLKMHMPPMARFVLPKNIYAGVPPHQDISYNKHLGEFVVVWVPFTKIDAECGGVIVHEGSGALDEQPLDADGKFWLPGIPDSGLKKVHFEMAPGDALLFNSRVIHESMPNTSDRVRYSCDFRFFAGTTATSRHYLDMSTWKVVAPPETAF